MSPNPWRSCFVKLKASGSEAAAALRDFPCLLYPRKLPRHLLTIVSAKGQLRTTRDHEMPRRLRN
jgi:hypothetical protein